MGIRNSEEMVISRFTTDKDGNPTGGDTFIYFPHPDATAITIRWQDGIVEPEGQNGAFIEDVLEAARQRLQFFNSTKFRCRENSLAITKIEEALMWLDARTKTRVTQGVENTYDTHTDMQPMSPTEALGDKARSQGTIEKPFA